MKTTLCQLAKDSFPARVRMRGDAYQSSGCVSMVNVDSEAITAQVRGGSLYDVRLTFDTSDSRPSMVGACSCPFFQDRGPCKHLWAVLRELDRAGTIDVPDDATIGFDGDVEDDFEGEVVESPRFIEAAHALGMMQKAKPKGWRALLGAMKHADVPASGYSTPAVAGQVAAQLDDVRYELVLDSAHEVGQLQVRAASRSVRRDGTPGKWKPINLLQYGAAIPDEDFVLATALTGVSMSQRQYYYGNGGYGPMDAAAARRLLPRVCATGRLVGVRAGAEFGPLAWDEGGDWTFTLALGSGDKAGGYALRGWLVRGEERRPLAEPVLLLAAGWIVWDDRISSLATCGGFGWISELRRAGSIPVPAGEARDLVDALIRQPRMPRLELPEDMRFQEVRVAPEPQLELAKPNPYDPRAVPARVVFRYDGHDIRSDSEGTWSIVEKPRRMIVRDLVAEQRHLALPAELGLRAGSAYGRDDYRYTVSVARVGAMVRRLVSEGWRVTAQGRLYRAPGVFEIAVESGVDWFDLRVGCDYAGESVGLPALLDAIRKKQDWVALGDGSVGILPEAWLKKYGAVAALGTLENESVRFSRAQAGILDAWLASQPEVQVDAIFARTREELARFTAIQPATAPQEFTGSLRPYQEEGLGWLLFLQRFGFGGCLADDMGLGKTVQVLALLADRRGKAPAGRVPPSLVVAPRSLIFNWLREAARFAPGLRCLDHSGADRRLAEGWQDAIDIVFTTYGTLRRDIGMLKEIAFDYVVLDESQAIKNAGAQTAKCVRLLRGAHRLALSGTPVENHLGELWSLFEFLNPGLLGAAAGFDRLWVRNPDAEQRSLLARALRPFILRRTKAQVAKDLPERQEDTQFCTLPTAQCKLYDELREHYRRSLAARVAKAGIAKSKIHVLEALLRLRQAACHPALVDDTRTDAPCAKFETLLPQLDEVLAEGHKALVFSQFTGFLALLRKELDARGIVYEYLDGRTRDRQQRVDRFQRDPACPLFLISLKAGGLGLNLTAADYVFLLDPWWNPAVEAQAIDRAHRIGQVNKVLAYRLIAKDTVEEKVLELQAQKRALAEAIIGADNALVRNLTREDLDFLLG